jgi:2-polyprenyl-3-methyl-5-hydroxy-6-metoxy-1,4-benzoquinol methylase
MTECPKCAGISPDPYPSENEINGYYQSAEEASDWEHEHYINPLGLPGQAAESAAFAQRITRLVGRPGNVLEIGCAGGWLLAAARDAGWETCGVEAAPKFARYARDVLGLHILENVISQIDPHAGLGPFDVVMMFDVFEHLQNPMRDLAILRQIVANDGYLLIATPNIGSPMAKFWGLRWRQIIPSHINFSTPLAMEQLLLRAGWKLERLSEPRYWDPDIAIERHTKRRERVKFFVRMALYITVVAPSRRLPILKRLPGVLTRGRMSWDAFLYRAGEQPVLGDVMFVTARPA